MDVKILRVSAKTHKRLALLAIQLDTTMFDLAEKLLDEVISPLENVTQKAISIQIEQRAWAGALVEIQATAAAEVQANKIKWITEFQKENKRYPRLDEMQNWTDGEQKRMEYVISETMREYDAAAE